MGRKVKNIALVLAIWLLLTPVFSLAGGREIPFELPPRSEILKLRSAVLYTDKGEIRFELYPQDAPWHVANFKYLADKGFYKNRPFHVYYLDYVIQTGLITKEEGTHYNYTLPPEFSEREHDPGTLGMARSPDDKNPGRRSSSTQFHILFNYAPKMDKTYTIFGHIAEGMEVLKRLQKGDMIRDLKVFVSD